MDHVTDRPRPTQECLPAGPALTDWLLTELDTIPAAVAVPALWIRVMRALVLKHRAVPSYVPNSDDPTGPDTHSGWHCQECGLDRDGPSDDWPCELLNMIATATWYVQRPDHETVAWAWTVPVEDEIVWRREA